MRGDLFMNDSILDFIFDARSEELAKLTEKDKEFLNSPKVDFDKTYTDLINTLKPLPADYQKTIIKKFNICIDIQDLIHAYFYKKYYKMGFSECMKLIINCNRI